jgi:hypothetical protein
MAVKRETYIWVRWRLEICRIRGWGDGRGRAPKGGGWWNPSSVGGSCCHAHRRPARTTANTPSNLLGATEPLLPSASAEVDPAGGRGI